VNTNHNRIVPIVIGAAVAIFAISMLLRFALFSEYGIPTSYLLVGLPGAGIGLVVLLLRLGVFTGGQRSSGINGPWQQNFGAQPPQYPGVAPFAGAPAPTASQHLQELDRQWQAGAISPADYAARRQQIIATI
jgi:hypothetical protein